MLVIVDYGMGNLGSIENMFRKIGAEVKISNDLNEIKNADKLILPGVGAFDNGISSLHSLGLVPILHKKVIVDKTPILGICLGMQLFTNKSAEGTLPGLGWIDAETNRFKFENENTKLKVPHMGWNTVDVVKKTAIFNKYYNESRYYFVHSYYVKCKHKDNVLATTQHGIEFDSAIIKDNIIGTQFHPEKSHKYGLKILRCFMEVTTC